MVKRVAEVLSRSEKLMDDGSAQNEDHYEERKQDYSQNEIDKINKVIRCLHHIV